MKNTEINSELNKTLVRRKRMADNLEHAFREAPKETQELLEIIAKIYYSGSIPLFWDVLANLAGAERGFGNTWFFTAIEIQKDLKGGEINE